MRAVFRAPYAYYQLAYDEVNSWELVYSEPYVDPMGRIVPRKVVGKSTRIAYDPQVYTFSEGGGHNQLTLTEPREILNMREWLKAHEDFIEVLCDEEAEELTEADIEAQCVEELPEVKPELKGRDASDWDYQYSRMLSNR